MTDTPTHSGLSSSEQDPEEARRQRWNRIDEIVELALDTAVEQRLAVLRDACGGDASLQGEVESLLAHVQVSDEMFSNMSAMLSGAGRSRSQAADERDDALVGSTVGPYVLQKPLKGGMASVYRAHDAKHDRPVVVKLIASGLAEEAEREATQRMAREAQTEVVLKHPNVCEVLDGGTTEDGRAYVVLEFCPGETLDVRLGSGSLSISDALHVVAQIADALAAAHALGITHRDVKPSNVMVSDEFDVKLLDFGVAKLEGHRLTKTGHVLGTLEYMSPEQLSGQPVEPSSDIWALGGLLAETLTGQHPFRQASKRQTVARILAPVPDPALSLSRFPDQLERLLPAMLQREAAQRPSASVVRDSLLYIRETLNTDER